MRVPGTAQHPSSIDPPNHLLRPALRLGTGVRRAPSRPGTGRAGEQDVDCHRRKIARSQIRGKLSLSDRGSGGQHPLLRRPREAGGPRVRATAVQQVRGGRGGRAAQGEAGRPGRDGARVRGPRRHLHPRGGRDRRGGAALLLPRRVLLHLRREDVGRRGRPVGGVLPRRRPDGRGVPPHLHLLPQGRLRHPHPQGGGPVLEIGLLYAYAVAAPKVVVRSLLFRATSGRGVSLLRWASSCHQFRSFDEIMAYELWQ
uniref:Uncharacterized protein n=1 Tax=Zea mays TaxID=4577 RepID=A0A804Q358_MAIZE